MRFERTAVKVARCVLGRGGGSNSSFLFDKTPEKTPEGVKLITAKVIKEGFIQEGNHEFIAEEN
ncbi:MAG: hypothetical protein Q8N94_01500 [Methanoregula sp.]|nr:hypothetical protein [Methanoregula sp.]